MEFVSDWIFVLGVPMFLKHFDKHRREHGRPWAKEEDDFLIEKHKSMTYEEIGLCLGRSRGGVAKRAGIIGVANGKK